jgi:hypothetical protein
MDSSERIFRAACLLRDQEETRLYLFVLTFRAILKVYALRRRSGECDTEVERRM